jgi:hypothetical protein
VLFGKLGHAEGSPRTEALLFANCPKEAGEYTGSYRGRVLLHAGFLAKMGERGIETSIEHQLRYLWGHYRNDERAHASLQMSLGAEPPDIRIVSTKNVSYGRDLSLTYTETAARLALDDPYSLAAVAAGRTRREDPAVLVEYEIHFRVAMCGRAVDPPPAADVPLPPDPWLAYWYVPKSKHRPLQYHDDRAITNPCADDDFADLPHPFYYWYDWLPTRHGPDAAGRSFDCRTLLRRGDHFHTFRVAFERFAAPAGDLLRLRGQLATGTITATVVIGATNHAVTDLELDSYRDQLGDGGPGELPMRALKIVDRSPIREGGTRSFLGVLADLDSTMSVSHHRSIVENGYLLVEVEGALKASARPVRVRFWLGHTDLFGPVVPGHFSILRRAIAEDRVVVYWGHSGIGENFRLAQIEKHVGISHAQMSAELRASPLRLTAFVSCYSYMYFGQDLLAAGAEREDGGTFVFTGMESSRREAGPLAIFDLVDSILRPDNPSGRLERLPRLGDDEFWLVKEVRKAP